MTTKQKPQPDTAAAPSAGIPGEANAGNTVPRTRRRLKLPVVEKPVIYQMLPRLFSNTNEKCVPNGDITENGCGKMNHITDKVLAAIRDLGATHVWYTGVIEHA
ncbi:MAG: hypothetical protein K2L78_04645, partial [Muribaculaceae bacterium]|nr:hypothetical protein [Muribaculaceae bacterium]